MTDDSTNFSAACRECGSPMDAHRSAPCPSCGKVGTRLVDAPLLFTVSAKAAMRATILSERQREFIEKNPNWYWPYIALTYGSPLLGLVFAGVEGVVVGLGVSALTHFVGLRAVINVREVVIRKTDLPADGDKLP